nr:ABC transporter substrate-binding protein [Candidatus Frankia alpina]
MISQQHLPPARRTKRGAVLGALLALAALVLSACGSGSGGGGGGGGGKSATLKWASSFFPTRWDPVVAGSGAQFRILALPYASLTKTDANGNAVPDLAQSWTYNTIGDEITFHVCPKLTFSDGTPVNAAAVKNAIDRAKTQKNSALFGDLTSIKSVTTSGDLDVVVHLTQVDHQIPLLLGERVLQIASPKAAADPANLDQHPVGAGPFVVTH